MTPHTFMYPKVTPVSASKGTTPAPRPAVSPPAPRTR
jgi:hypothetical protein